MLYQNNGINNSAEVFARTIAKINFIVVALFFEATCFHIFEYLLAAGFKDKGLLSPIFTYFGTIKTND